MRGAFEAGDGTGDDGSDAVLELVVNAALLVLADELDHDLLGGLCCDAAQGRERDGLTAAHDADVTGLAVEGDCELAGILGVELLAQRRTDCLLDIGVDLFAINVLVACDPIHDAEQILIGHSSSLLINKFPGSGFPR